VAARKVFTQATNLKYILTMEILADLQAMSFKEPSKLGKEIAKHYQKLAAEFKVYDSTTVFHDLLVKFMNLIFDQNILNLERVLS
jgi:histidine ammonia-lyase